MEKLKRQKNQDCPVRTAKTFMITLITVRLAYLCVLKPVEATSSVKAVPTRSKIWPAVGNPTMGIIAFIVIYDLECSYMQL